MLTDLQAAEFIYEQPAVGDFSYVFKHALSQQVAYGSALNERRKVLHQGIAQALEASFPETVETQPELIAHHFTEAGLGEQAIPYWQRAAERALERSAGAEARNHLNRGIELLLAAMNTPERSEYKRADQLLHCKLMLLLGQARKSKGEYLEAQETIERAAEIARSIDSIDLLVDAALELSRMSAWYGVSSEPAVRLLEFASEKLDADEGPLKAKVLSGLAQALAAAGFR